MILSRQRCLPQQTLRTIQGRAHRLPTSPFRSKEDEPITRSLTTTTTSPRVISRRLWQQYLAKQPRRAKKPKKPTEEEKPWPRNVQIAGGVAAALFVPYTLTWFVTSNPTVRNSLLDANLLSLEMLDRVRSHFGDVEWNGQSYTDSLKKDQSVIYQFPDEDTQQQRDQQVKVEAMNASSVTTRLTLSSPKTQDEAMIESSIQTIPASSPATLASLSQQLASSQPNQSSGDYKQNRVRAVDFMDDDEQNSNASFPSDSFSLADDGMDLDGSGTNHGSGDADPSHSFKHQYPVYSSWYHHPTTDDQNSNEDRAAAANKNHITDDDMEVSRLEYTIGELERDLKDPLCTKDIDTMRETLRSSKKELSRLKWKRRLGGWK